LFHRWSIARRLFVANLLFVLVLTAVFGAFSVLEARDRAYEDAGSRMERVVKVTCFLADAGAFGILNDLFEEYFPGNPPARSAPVVALPRGLLFSIEAIAVAERAL